MKSDWIKFLKFLDENGALLKYLLNAGMNSSVIKADVLPDYFICGAFLWNNAEEGWDYWGDLNEKWGHEIKQSEERT